MRPAGATNFKWSIADVDLVVGLARSGRTAVDICQRLRGNGGYNFRKIEAAPEEIRDLCWQSGLTVKMGSEERA